jgi:hypothetical protein
MPPIEGPEASVYGSAVSPTGYIIVGNALAWNSENDLSFVTRSVSEEMLEVLAHASGYDPLHRFKNALANFTIERLSPARDPSVESLGDLHYYLSQNFL